MLFFLCKLLSFEICEDYLSSSRHLFGKNPSLRCYFPVFQRESQIWPILLVSIFVFAIERLELIICCFLHKLNRLQGYVESRVCKLCAVAKQCKCWQNHVKKPLCAHSLPLRDDKACKPSNYSSQSLFQSITNITFVISSLFLMGEAFYEHSSCPKMTCCSAVA